MIVRVPLSKWDINQSAYSARVLEDYNGNGIHRTVAVQRRRRDIQELHENASRGVYTQSA